MKSQFKQTAGQDFPILNQDREAMVSMRELHDSMRNVIDVLKTRLDPNDPRIEEACRISNEMSRLFCDVLGGIGNAVCVTAPKKYMSRDI